MSFCITSALPALLNAEIVLVIRAGVLTFSDPPDSPPWPCFAHACLRRIVRPPVGFELCGRTLSCLLFLGRSGVNLGPILTGLGIRRARCAPVAFGEPLALHDVQSGLAIRAGFVALVSMIHGIGRQVMVLVVRWHDCVLRRKNLVPDWLLCVKGGLGMDALLNRLRMAFMDKGERRINFCETSCETILCRSGLYLFDFTQ